MITLSKKQIIMLHSQLIAETGGTDGIRDEAGEDEHEPAGEQECTFPEAAADEEPVLHPGGYADDADEG